MSIPLCSLTGLIMFLQCSTSPVLQTLNTFEEQPAHCPETFRSLNRSLIYAWRDTGKVETLVTAKYDVNKDICLQAGSLMTKKEYGVELIRTLETIRCFVMAGNFAKEHMQLMNEVTLSISEVVIHPEVCLQDKDFVKVPCSKSMAFYNHDELYKTVQQQRSLLQALFISSWTDPYESEY